MSDVGENPVDWEKDDSPDPGSAAATAVMGIVPSVTGVIEAVPTTLIVPAEGQRSLSDAWVKKHMSEGWNDPLGHGIVVNRVTTATFAKTSVASTQRGQQVLAAAKAMKSKYVFSVVIGQHRTALALALGMEELTCYVLDNLTPVECMQLYVADARATRPLRGYDVHKAALVGGEPRALVIQDELDRRNITLVPTGLKEGTVSCIRAFEKACGSPETSASDPDEVRLHWHMDVLSRAFPKGMWPDALVQGLTFCLRDYEAAGVSMLSISTEDLGRNANKHWKGDVRVAVEAVKMARKLLTAAQPATAARLWSTLFALSGIVMPEAPSAPAPRRKLKRVAS